MPESARSALRKARQNGHQIVLCSSRSKYQIYPWLLEPGFDGIVAAAGAYAEHNGEIIYQHFMSEDELYKAVTLLDHAGACCSAQAAGRMITSASHRIRHLARFKKLADEEMISQIWQHVELSDQIWQHEDVEKLVYYESTMNVAEIQKQPAGICDVTESSFETEQSDSGEITCCGINKAHGMEKYIIHTGMAKADIIAFGDGPNDFDMISYAAVGMAMGNAVEALKSQADFVTKGIDEDGIAYALLELGLI